jgi:acetylornithine deacetylase
LLSAPGITIGEIHGGIGASTVAGNCVVRFDAEFFSPDVNSELADVSYSIDKSGVRKAVEDTILQTCTGDPWLAKNPVKVNWYQDTSTFFISQRHPLLINLTEQLTKDGFVPKIRGFPAGCDAVYLTNIGNTPTVLFGPGNILQAHSNDEYVEIEQYLIYQMALGAFIIRWTESK